MIDLAIYPKFAADAKLMKRSAFLEIEWRRAYTDVDFDKQVGWAHAWLITSGKKYHDMARYLNSWFRRCQADIDKAKTAGGPIVLPRSNYKESLPEGEVMTPEDWARMREAIRRPQK